MGRSEQDRGECRLEEQFPATTENVELFIARIHDFLVEQHLGMLAFELELLAREALTNAVVHGSGGDPGKSVAASLHLESGSLILSVHDQGPGWDWRSPSLADPVPGSGTGRGLFVIRKYSDTHVFNDSGNTLTISKAVPAQGPGRENPGEGVARMAFEPQVTAQEVPALRRRIQELIQPGMRLLECDCSRLQGIDSLGLSLLVATRNSLAKQGAALVLAGLNTDMHQLLLHVRLDKHITLIPMREAKT